MIRGEAVPRHLLGQLTTFVAVAETLSFSRAAEVIGRSQPAVTAHIVQLEDYLGVKLFSRTTRQVRLTPAGSELLIRSKRLLTDAQRMVGEFQLQAGQPTGQVIASFSPTIAVSLVPHALNGFIEDYPGISVMLREDLGPEMFEAVETGQADFGMGPYARVPEHLTFRPIFDQEFFLIVPASHPIAVRGFVRLRELQDIDIICSSVGSTAREVLDEAARSAGIRIRPRFEALQYPTLFTLAAAGLGATVMPAVSPDLLTGLRLAAVPFRGRRLKRTIGAITRREDPLPVAAATLLQRLVETAEQEGHRLGLE